MDGTSRELTRELVPLVMEAAPHAAAVHAPNPAPGGAHRASQSEGQEEPRAGSGRGAAARAPPCARAVGRLGPLGVPVDFRSVRTDGTLVARHGDVRLSLRRALTAERARALKPRKPHCWGAASRRSSTSPKNADRHVAWVRFPPPPSVRCRFDNVCPADREVFASGRSRRRSGRYEPFDPT